MTTPDYNPPRRRNGRTWAAHDGRQARLRRLRQRCRVVLRTKDAGSVDLLDRLRCAVADDPEPEYAVLNAISHAIDTAEGTGVHWRDALGFFLTKFNEQDAVSAEAPPVNFLHLMGVSQLDTPKAYASRPITAPGVLVPINIDPTVPDGVIEFRDGHGIVHTRVTVDAPPAFIGPRSRLRRLIDAATASWRTPRE